MRAARRVGAGVAYLERERWQTLSALLDELLDADIAVRGARVDSLRRTDPALARELEALLGHEARVRTERFLEGSALGGGEGLEGWVLGGWTLEAPIGRGGMGSVWLARRSDGRYEGKAAVKLINLALMGRDGAQRFQREGSILARLSHPHIARLLDAGLAPGGQPYLVLEYVDGEPIDRWCDARRSSVEERLRLFLDVVDAVADAHSHLVVHLDLKPSNILVTADGDVKLLDFGVSRLIDEGGGNETRSGTTVAGARAFTPDFAAPEQLRGEPVSSATDVYALGALLYLLLCGQHPTAPHGGNLVQRVHAATHVEPVRLSVAVEEGAAGGGVDAGGLATCASDRGSTPAGLARRLAGDLDNIVAKALRKEPRERYATPTALADDLRRHFAHEPVLARADTFGYRTARYVMRHRWGLAVVAAVALSLSIGAGVAVWQSIEAEQRRAEAELDLQRATASLHLLLAVLSDSGAMSARTMGERLARIRQMVRESGESPEVKLQLYERLAGRYMELGALDDMLAMLGEMRELAKGVKDPEEHAVIACAHANAYVVLGRNDDAERELAAAAKLLAHVPARSLGARTECWQAEAELALLRGQLPRALEAARRSVEALERRGLTRDPVYSAALNQLALSYAGVADYRGSYQTARKARDALRVVNLQGTQQDLIVAMQEIDMLAKGGKPLEALRLLTDLRADPHVAVEQQVPRFAIEERLGKISMKLDRAGEAVDAFEACIESAHAGGNRLFEQSCNIRALEALVALSRLDDARARLAALPALVEEIARGTPTGAQVLTVRARMALVAGAPAAAALDVNQALELLGAMAWPDPRLRDALVVAARVAEAQGRAQQALETAKAADVRARAESIDPASSSEVGEVLVLEARLEAALGHADAARTLAADALPQLRENLGPFHPASVEARARASGTR
jgi:serine/threonine-protein kinase